MSIFISNRYSDSGNNGFAPIRYETIDMILGKKCLAFSSPYSTASAYDSISQLADYICEDFQKFERLHNEIKRIAIAPNCAGHIKYVESGISFSDLYHRINKFKSAGLLKSAVFGSDCVFIAVEPSAVGFLTRDFAVLHTVSELRRRGAADVRYNCQLRDTHTAKQLNIDIICQRERGGRAEFIMVIPNSRLAEYTNPNNVKHYRKIVVAAERLKGLTLVVSPSVDTAVLKRILASYTKYPIHIVKLSDLRFI